MTGEALPRQLEREEQAWEAGHKAGRAFEASTGRGVVLDQVRAWLLHQIEQGFIPTSAGPAFDREFDRT